jgi:hypothetical protein
VPDEQHGRNDAARLFPKIEQDVLELTPGDIVQRAERLVQEQDCSAIRKDSRDSDSLQHPARKVTWPGLLDMRKADPAQIIARAISRRSPLLAPTPVFPDGYAFIFKDNNSFTMSDGSIGPASESANPSGSNTLPLWGHSGDASPDGDISTESIRPITHLRSPKKSVA